MTTQLNLSSSNSSDTKYWGGWSVTGNIKPLQNADTFQDLYTNYFVKGVSTPHTRQDYTAMPAEKRKEIKLNGGYITACSFIEHTTKRKDANAHLLHLIILDVDGTTEAQMLIDLKDKMRDQMGDINFFVHTTISHTDAEPKLRVVVEIEECDIRQRKAATRHVANLLGLTKHTLDEDGNAIGIVDGFDLCSNVTSQAFFRPVEFLDDTEGSHIIDSKIDGRAMNVLEIPEEVYKEITALGKGSRNRKRVSYADSEIYDEEGARKDSYSPYTKEEAKKVIVYISHNSNSGKDLEYTDWYPLFNGFANSYGVEYACAVFKELLPEVYEGEYDEKLASRTEEHTFGTPLHTATQLGFDKATITPSSDLKKRANDAKESLVKLKKLASLPKQFDFYSQMQEDKVQPVTPVIDGLIGVGEKLMISAPSKFGKTWVLLDLAKTVSEGGTWFGFKVPKMKVVLLNFEFTRERLNERLKIIGGFNDNVLIDHLKGHSLTAELIVERLEKMLQDVDDVKLIIIDPIYKLLGDKDENDNSQIGKLLNSIGELARATEAAVVFAHHFSKGSKANTSQIDRASGAGAWARDPDAIVTLSEHEESDIAIFEATVRNYKEPKPTAWRRTFPKWTSSTEDPRKTKKHGGSNAKMSVRDVVSFLTDKGGTLNMSELKKGLASHHEADPKTAKSWIDRAITQSKIFLADSTEKNPTLSVLDNTLLPEL